MLFLVLQSFSIVYYGFCFLFCLGRSIVFVIFALNIAWVNWRPKILQIRIFHQFWKFSKHHLKMFSLCFYCLFLEILFDMCDTCSVSDNSYFLYLWIYVIYLDNFSSFISLILSLSLVSLLTWSFIIPFVFISPQICLILLIWSFSFLFLRYWFYIPYHTCFL